MQERCDDGDQGVQTAEFQNRHSTRRFQAVRLRRFGAVSKLQPGRREMTQILYPCNTLKVFAVIIKAATSRQRCKLSQPKIIKWTSTHEFAGFWELKCPLGSLRQWFSAPLALVGGFAVSSLEPISRCCASYWLKSFCDSDVLLQCRRCR